MIVAAKPARHIAGVTSDTNKPKIRVLVGGRIEESPEPRAQPETLEGEGRLAASAPGRRNTPESGVEMPGDEQTRCRRRRRQTQSRQQIGNMAQHRRHRCARGVDDSGACCSLREPRVEGQRFAIAAAQNRADIRLARRRRPLRIARRKPEIVLIVIEAPLRCRPSGVQSLVTRRRMAERRQFRPCQAKTRP